MTIEEASKKYNIPIKILKEYESWGLFQEVKKVMGSWQYDETDLERLSLIMTLHDLDFTVEEVEKYMKLSLEKNEGECLNLFHPLFSQSISYLK
jgi:DNA-binding transcriptional MerR regulator